MPGKTSKRRATIELYCESEEQKQEINALAAERGLSTSKFLIGLALSNGRDVGARRRTEGALGNAHLHWQLGQILERLLDRADYSAQEKDQLLTLLQETQRSIALHRLSTTNEEVSHG